VEKLYLTNIFCSLKDEIIKDALKLFLQHGIRSMTMQKLASAIGMSTKTLYKFFADKEALLEACLNVHYADMFSGIEELVTTESDPVTFVCAVFARSTALDFGANHLFYHDLNYYYPHLQDKIIHQQAGEFGPILIGVMQRGLDQGYFLPYLQPIVAFKALSVLYTSVTRFDTYTEFNLTPEQLVQHTIDIYLRGICTEKGLETINRIKNSTP